MILYKRDDLERYTDERGYIHAMLPDGVNIKSALFITGKRGSKRGNHIHKVDTHYCYVVSGLIIYKYRVNKDSLEDIFVTLYPGDMVYTPTGEPHVFIFEEDSVFIALATEARDQKTYENDITRITV